MYFYFNETTQLWRIGDKDYQNPRFVFSPSGSKVTILADNKPVYTDGDVVLLKRANDTNYSDYSTLISETSPFFGNASEREFYKSVAEAKYSYGILIDNNLSSPLVTRIGNIDLHKSLPVHNNMKGCLLADNGTVNYYLMPTDWTKKADGTASVLDGTDGQVMVEIPAYYRTYKMLDNMKFEVRISQNYIPGYVLMPKRYISAYKASLQRSTNKLSSVINTSTDFRGGTNNASYDGTSKTLLGKPATNISLTNFRAYARNRASGNRWNCMTYDLRKSLFWLFAIEYANLNSQAAVAAKDSVTGLAQGGLGNGITTANSTEWSNFNAYNPFCGCGVTNSLGNASGEVSFTVADFGGTGLNRSFTANRYRGIENPFGDMLEHTDGILIDVKTDASGATSTLYTSSDPEKFTSSQLSNYNLKGLISRAEGYVRQMLLGSEGDIIPVIAVGANSTTFYCDYFYRSIAANEIKCVLFGGVANEGAPAGLVYSIANYAPSYAYAYVGSRLCFI